MKRPSREKTCRATDKTTKDEETGDADHPLDPGGDGLKAVLDGFSPYARSNIEIRAGRTTTKFNCR